MTIYIIPCILLTISMAKHKQLMAYLFDWNWYCIRRSWTGVAPAKRVGYLQYFHKLYISLCVLDQNSNS